MTNRSLQALRLLFIFIAIAGSPTATFGCQTLVPHDLAIEFPCNEGYIPSNSQSNPLSMLGVLIALTILFALAGRYNVAPSRLCRGITPPIIIPPPRNA